MVLVISKGAYGIPGSTIIILVATLSVTPAIPAISLVLVLSVDWFIGVARALSSLIGNCVAMAIITMWGKDIDCARTSAVFDGRIGITEEDEAAPRGLGVTMPVAHMLPHA